MRTNASRLMVPAPAGPDIHLQSETPKSPHRRLSLCSLPVPKQTNVASEVAFLAQPTNCRTWQPAHRVIPFLFFLYKEGFFKLLPCRPKFRPARSLVPFGPRPACRPPVSWPRRVLPDSSSRAAALFREPGPTRESTLEPIWLLPPARAGYACSSAWKSACA